LRPSNNHFEKTTLRFEKYARAGLISVLFLITGALLYVKAEEAVRSGGRRVGIGSEEGTAGVRVTAVAAGLPADRGGLRRGDEILAVDGLPVHGQGDYQRTAARLRRGRPAVFHVTRNGRALDLEIVPGVAPSWTSWTVFGLDGVTALGFLVIACLALAQRPQGSGDLRSRLLAAFSLAATAELVLPINSVGHAPVLFAARSAYYLLTGLQMGLELHLASLIPERPAWLARRPWVVPLYYAVGIGSGTLTCATFISEEILGRKVFPWSADTIAALLSDVGLPAWAVAVSVLLASRALRHPEPAGRQQAGLVLAGTFPWLLYSLAAAVSARVGWPLPGWTDALEALVLLCFPAALFAAIHRTHLFDLELVVRRSLIYTTLTGTLILVFYATLGAGGVLFSNLLEGRDSAWVVSGSTLLLGLLFSPLRRALQRLIDRRFFPERRALRQRLVALAGELPALGKLPLMGEHLVIRLTAIFGTRSAALLLANPETGLLGILAAAGRDGETVDRGLLLSLDDPGAEHLRRAGRPLAPAQLAARSPAFQRFPALDPEGLAVPLLNQDQLIGVVLVGRKEGRRAYPAEEVDLLNLLAHHVATVFENARLFESATYESLTGLLRREAILGQLDKEMERAVRYDRPLTIAMADLDFFKDVNDRYGHLAGDTLLKRISQVIAGALRSTDWIGRYGGEEFLLVLPETDITGACGVAEKIRALVQRTPVAMEDGALARVTLSIGLASLDELGARAAARDLIAAADRSLYEAKNGGRNRIFPLVA
jgi:diguanylate cyclase (GGDEF)-like protein